MFNLTVANSVTSKLMQIIVENLRNCSKPAALLPPLDVFSGIGSLTFTQLSTLRHRGAFATVSSTFISCCQLTLKLTEAFPDGPKIEDYLQRWYEVNRYPSHPYSHTQASTKTSIGGIKMHSEPGVNNAALCWYTGLNHRNPVYKLKVAVFQGGPPNSC